MQPPNGNNGGLVPSFGGKAAINSAIAGAVVQTPEHSNGNQAVKTAGGSVILTGEEADF